MARTRAIPVVREGSLAWGDGDRSPSIIVVGTPRWYTWLEQATSFRFDSLLGSFTARKERSQRGGPYWKAYKSRLGKVHQSYLGKTETLTLERLDTVAAKLAGAISGESSPVPPEAKAGAALDREQFLPSKEKNPSQRSPNEALSGNLKGDLLIKTKLALPPPRFELLDRPRLLSQLDQGLAHKLTLISAPAGFGKTTLLSQWISHLDKPVAWVSLDAGDNDSTRFWTYFISALRTIYPLLGAQALRMLQSPRPPSTESLLAVIVNTLASLPDDLVLVLDEFETIKAQPIYAALDYLLDHLPPQVHLVITTRVDPPLALSHLRARRQMVELRAMDLSFTRAESKDLLTLVMGLSPSAEDLAAVVEQAEGWITGLQLSALLLRTGSNSEAFIKSFSGEQRHIWDYFKEEVLRRQPRELQAFLMQTSILDRLNGSLCEAVTRRDNGQAALERLERANLFTSPLDQERHWYRYHNLFTEFLQSNLNRTLPVQVPELHRRAAVWHAEHGMVNVAVRHALAAKDFELAGDLIERVAESLRLRGEVKTALDWFDLLPEEVIRTRPRLCLAHLWALHYSRQMEAYEARLLDLERCLGLDGEGRPTNGEISSGLDPETFRWLRREAISGHASLAFDRGDIPRAITLGKWALDLTRDDDEVARITVAKALGSAYRLNGDAAKASKVLSEAENWSREHGLFYATIESACDLASVQLTLGRLHAAAKIYKSAQQLATEQNNPPLPTAAAPYTGLGRLSYEWNDLRTAADYCDKGLDLAQHSGYTVVIVPGYELLAGLKRAQGDIDGALAILNQMEQIARSGKLPWMIGRVGVLRTRLLLRQGDVEAAARWAEQTGLSMDDDPIYSREAEYRTLADLKVSQGRPIDAVVLLDRLLLGAESQKRIGSLIKILVQRAVALDYCGEERKAFNSLLRALSLAEPGGYVRTFVDAGDRIARLLSELRKQWNQGRGSSGSDSLGYLCKLLSAMRPPPLRPALADRNAHSPATAGLLSEREAEVLRMVAAGRSNAEIAEQLVVAVSTVKTHIKNTYEKLGAHNRITAIARGRELNLLS